MTRFRLRFRGSRDGSPVLGAMPVIYSPHLQTSDGSTTMLVHSPEHGHWPIVLTNDPDFEWHFYLYECHQEASRIVREGLRRRLPWLRLEATP
jgi:hypothetical protein